jgi:hypothetical protein
VNHKSSRAFSAVELVVGIILFSVATTGILYMGKSMRDNQTAASSANEQNAYATFQSQVTLQGINPSLVANPMAGAINQGGTITGAAPSAGANLNAAFELGAVSQPVQAQRDQGGSVLVDAVNYTVASAGDQGTRGAGIGFAIETTGPAAPSAANAIQLAPPSFSVTGDLTAWFQSNPTLTNIAVLPSSNPPGTVYRYTTDGSTPTGASTLWDNPSWTPATFPAQLALEAFNPNPQYSPSSAVTATYSMQLSLTYARADGRSDLYDFSISDLAAPDATGIVLSDNINGYTIFYTTDGSDPTTSGTAVAYSGAFAPPQGQFNPGVTLNAIAVANDPRINNSPVMTYVLNSTALALTPPTFITSNAQPLAPGTDVVLSVSGSASPRTEVNNGTPGQQSSQATSFPLN